MTQLERDPGDVNREAYAAVDDATRLTVSPFGDLLELIRERITLREVKSDIPPGAMIRDLRGNTVDLSRSRGIYTADHCPFCGEERSFRVNEGANLWSCEDCFVRSAKGSGSRVGGAIEWVMLIDDVSGADAVRRLRARGWFQQKEPGGTDR